MQTLYNILMVLGLIVAVIFILLVFVTGKGDAMSGGGGVRTNFKGKTSIEDQISRLNLIVGIGFMALMIILDALSNRLPK